MYARIDDPLGYYVLLLVIINHGFFDAIMGLSMRPEPSFTVWIYNDDSSGGIGSRAMGGYYWLERVRSRIRQCDD